MEPAKWRLLKHKPARGAWNMAVDEAILESTVAGRSLPTLRLYAWQPACLSLGHGQPVADVDMARLSANGWDVVRRPTGGRAILHTDELTYAVIGPKDEPRLAGDILTSYKRISAALMAALEILGLPVQSSPNTAQEPNSAPDPVCFEVPSNYEITAGGKKLVGSAQARRLEGVLQHGTLPLYGDLSRITQALEFSSEMEREKAAEKLLARATTVETVLGRAVSWEEAADAFVQAFSDTLSLELVPGEISRSEKQRAEELFVNKYANPDWTGKS
jgi:lipoate-protein ligase A